MISYLGTSDEDVIEETENLVETSPHPEDLSEEICPSSPRDSTPSKTLTRNTLQQEFELLTLNLGSVKAEGLSGSGKRSIKFTATVAANQVRSILFRTDSKISKRFCGWYFFNLVPDINRLL